MLKIVLCLHMNVFFFFFFPPLHVFANPLKLTHVGSTGRLKARRETEINRAMRLVPQSYVALITAARSRSVFWSCGRLDHGLGNPALKLHGDALYWINSRLFCKHAPPWSG